MAFGKKRKKYNKPRMMFDSERIQEENSLIKKYGLKNKKEIWKAEAEIEKLRNRAKQLITASEEEQKIFLEKLRKIGLKAERIADVLALNKEDFLKRRLQSVLIMKKRVKPREARQLITHKHVKVEDNIINVPSYLVKIKEEDKIKILKKKDGN